MGSILAPGVHLHRNPQFKPGLDALVLFLMDRDYSNHARWAVYDHAATHGTLAGTPCLDPEDEAEAEAIFVDALPPLGFDSPAWDKPDAFLDAELLAEGRHPEPFGDGPDAPDDPRYFGPGRMTAEALDALYAAELGRQAAALGIMPIAGGAPEPFAPSAEDWADYHSYCDMIDALDAERRASGPARYGYED